MLSHIKKSTYVVGIVIIVLFVILYHFLKPQECNVAVVNLTGEMFTTIDPTDTTDQQVTSDQVDQQLETANNNPHIKAIILSIDSPGGQPTAGEDIMKELKSINKPTVALARSEDNSAAYLASLGADTIFAADTSSVGDIGITSSYTDNSVQDQQNGITFNQLSVGKYKDMFNIDKPLTDDERTLEMDHVQKLYNIFVQLVADNRHMSFATAENLANGSEYLGNDALNNGLIDHVGNMQDVEQYLKEKVGKKVRICDYKN
jgi:protease-4